MRLEIPASFLPEIAQGTFELGDADEPTNSYHFGKQAEVFDLIYCGKAQCKSGYVGVITKERLQQSNPSWTELKDKIDMETISFPDNQSGLEFAGPVVQADSISVYKYEEAGQIKGLVLSSDVEEMD